MKRNGILLFIITLFLLVIIVLKQNNTDKEEIQIIPSIDIEFSKASGFYSEEFYVKLTSKQGYDIYYTLDGSDPSKESFLYKEPIFIENCDEKPNIYAQRTDTSTGFLKDDIEKYSLNLVEPNYISPTYGVEKCTVVRAISYDEQGESTEIVNKVYFVGEKEEKSYQNIGVMSIVTNPENLFNHKTGIYVTGKIYEDYANSEREHWAEKYWCHWPANYTQRGREWERVAWLDYFDVEGEHIWGQNAGIRIHGGGSRGFAEKSLNLYSRNEYGEKRVFSEDVFDSGYQAHKLVLFSGGDDVGSKLKDYLVNTLSQELNIATMDFTPCALFLDGEYWGVYYLTEAYDKDYIKFHYNVNNAIMIKNGQLEEGFNSGLKKYQDMVAFLEENDMSKKENYEKACELIDVDSYIDYYASLIYVGRSGDWPKTNVALWRSDTVSGRQYEDGRWRFMVFDVNSSGSVGSTHREEDTLRKTIEIDGGFQSLLKNSEFKKKFCMRLMDIGNVVYQEERVSQFIDEYIEIMSTSMKENNRRFYGEEDSENKFSDDVNDVKNFFIGRQEVVLHSINQNFDFEDDISSLQVEISDEMAGKIQINSMEVEFQDNNWKGWYIPQYPVTLQVKVMDGYKFLGWKLSDGSVLMDDTIEVLLENDVEKIEAIFQKTE